MTELDLQRMRNQDRSPGSSSSSPVNAWCDLRQTASTFCQMGVLGQSIPQAPSSAVKIGLGGNPRTETQSPWILKDKEEALGILVQPSSCHWGDDGHELVLGLLAHPSLPPQMDPVQKAVLSHTFGGPLLKTKRPIISCNVCQIRFNSQVRSPATHPLNGWSRSSQGILGEDIGWELWVRGRD